MKLSSAGMSFVRDRRGNIALMFGLMLFVILGGAGIAIDVQRSNLVRAEIAEASDAAVLAAARYRSAHPNADNDELTAIARRVFDNGLKNKSLVDISAFKVEFDEKTERFSIDVDGAMDALIMGVVGNKYVDIGANAEVRLGRPPLLEVALVLDTTGSMKEDNKMVTLKKAGKDLVDSLFAGEGAGVKVGVVPFAQYVNVGKANKSAAWISGTAPPWLGCVGSRAYPYNTLDTDYLVEKARGVTVNKNDPSREAGDPTECPAELLPLTGDDAKVQAKISGLSPQGLTYIPGGLVWGWALLTPTEPFKEGVTYAKLEEEGGTKALVLMTDGDNTRAPTYPLHESATKSLADQLTSELCANIKKEEIVVYTIAFKISDPVIKDVLEKCATTPNHYFEAEQSADLVAAFASIATSLRGLSLSK